MGPNYHQIVIPLMSPQLLARLVAWLHHLLRWLHPIKVFLIWVRFLYVPLLAALVAAGLGWVASSGMGPAALVKGAYDGTTKLALLLAPVSMFYAIALWEISRVILKYGPARFSVEKCKGLPFRIGQVALALTFAAVPIFTFFASSATMPEGFGKWHWLVWLGCALVFVGGYLWLSGVVNRFLVKWIQKSSILRGFTAQGYASLDEQNRPNGIGAGHVLQGILFGFSSCMVLILSRFPSEKVPAALYVLVILLTAAWLCSGLGFFLTKHRVPLLLVLALWVSVGGFFFHKPYTYRVIEMAKPTCLPAAQEILEMNYQDATQTKVPRRIVVAAVGGGIHAGAWEVEVLTHLQMLEGCADFPKRIALLSGTSGGAYGAMHYVHAIFSEGGADALKKGNTLYPEQRKGLKELREIVQKTSLGAVIHSMAYDDLPGYFHPQISPLDRGTAMEHQWVSNGKPGLADVTLADWARKASAGQMPAVIFTSGTEESGRPTLYGSTAVADWNWNADQTDKHQKDSRSALEDYTLRVVTGARLSASFPYVSPAASPDAPRAKLRRIEHQVDGGLYDNYGIVALNQWLDEGLLAQSGKFNGAYPKPLDEKLKDEWLVKKKAWMTEQGFGKILVIQIRYEVDDQEPEPAQDGFFHQLLAPLNTLVTTRVAGQKIRADRHFDIFCRYWLEQGIQIDNAAFDFRGAAPLSWHLTIEDKKCLSENGERICSEFQKYPIELAALKAKFKEGQKLTEAVEKLKSRLPLGASSFIVAEFIKNSAR